MRLLFVYPRCSAEVVKEIKENRKCLAKMTVTIQLMTADDEFLSRSQSGAIWGRIYFSLEDTFFPRQRVDGPNRRISNSLAGCINKSPQRIKQ